MIIHRRELDIVISARQFKAWGVAAASLGLSVQDYVRRAVSYYDPSTRTVLRDMDSQIDRYIAKYDELIAQAQQLSDLLGPSSAAN